MKKDLFIPRAYFNNIKKITEIIVDSKIKYLTANQIADYMGTSSIYDTLQAMEALGILDHHGNKYNLSETGENFFRYLERKEYDNLRQLGEQIIINNPKFEILKVSLQRIRQFPDITDIDLGLYISNKFNITTWKSDRSFTKAGGTCKGLLKGFNLISNEENQKLRINSNFIEKNHEEEIFNSLYQDTIQFLSVVSENESGWKNHLEIRNKLLKNYDELIKNQTDFLIKDYIITSKNWLNEGFNTRNKEYIYRSIERMARLQLKGLI